MEVLNAYSVALWRVYEKTKETVVGRKLSREDTVRLSKVLFETKRLCVLTDKQRDDWMRGDRSTWPIDPYTARDPEQPLVYKLEGYPHASPEIKRFMDRSAVEYMKIMSKNPRKKRSFFLFRI